MASSDLGDLGPGESEPTVVEWHWYYHLPSFAGWALIVALLVLLKENRTRQAWLILIPFLLLSEIVWPMAERISPLAAQYSFSFQWLFVAWTAIWLLSPWLARRRPILAFVLALGLAEIMGLVAQFHVYGRGFSLPWFDYEYAVSIVALLLACTLSGLCCRKTYRPWRFMVWLAPWLMLGVGLGYTCAFAWVFSGRWSSPPLLSIVQGRVVPASLKLAPVLYLVNLPFMILAFLCPTYRDRFHKVLRLPANAAPAIISAQKLTPESLPGTD